MNSKDRELIEAMLVCMRPFARAYLGCTPAMQLALDEHCPVRVVHLRDAYLLCHQIEQKLKLRDTNPSWR